MRRFWKRQPDAVDVEAERRARRSEPRPDFVRTVAGRQHDAPAGRGAARLRVALAGALTTVILVALAMTGGLGYAASAGKQAVEAVQDAVASSSDAGKQPEANAGGEPARANAGKQAQPQAAQQAQARAGQQAETQRGTQAAPQRKFKPKKTKAIRRASPAQAQYKVTICHRTGSETNPWVPISVSSRALPAHMRHGDFIVTPTRVCPPPTP